MLAILRVGIAGSGKSAYGRMLGNATIRLVSNKRA
jgi:hypothetical protein